MNLIVCGENCVHQCDGYCGLDDIREITDPGAASKSHCIYYMPKIAPTFPVFPEDSPAQPHDPERL